jgi:hypothetical protein
LLNIPNSFQELRSVWSTEGITDFAASVTVTAVHGTVMVRVKENTVWVTMGNAGYRHISFLSEGVFKSILVAP